MREKQTPYIPKPIAIWSFSKSSLIENKRTDMLVSKTNVGIDPLWTPAGFLGSPLLSPWMETKSHLLVDYKPPTPSWPGITLACWLRFDEFDDAELLTKKIAITVSRRDID